MPSLFFDHLFTGSAWLEAVRVEVAETGDIVSVAEHASADGATRFSGCALPGVPNLHSHAHQRAMAGLAERSGLGEDSFWTWREVMYRHAARLRPEDLEAVAAQLYVEMLEAGFTAVGEFQYLHHDPSGLLYNDVAEMSHRCRAAAEEVGIGLTSLPVLYTSSGFGGRPVAAAQRRFANDIDTFMAIVEALVTHRSPQHAVGIAPHSLRAVPPKDLGSVLAAFGARGPIHIHVAEQQQEVEDCVAWCRARPVAWLLGNAPVDAAWCLIHATHLDDAEVSGMARSGAVAGLCPTTEANLGDGLFRAQDVLAAGGLIGIGSDSHISISPVEELRWLEYGQRLSAQRRVCLAGGPGRSAGRHLFEAVLAGGAQALGRDIGRVEAGCRADFVVLDTDHPLLYGRAGDAQLDSWIFAGNQPLVRDVVVGGTHCVSAGRHSLRERIATRFRATMDRLFEDAE